MRGLNGRIVKKLDNEMGEQAGVRKEPAEPQETNHPLAFIIFSLLLPVLLPTSLSNFRPQSKVIYKVRHRMISFTP